MTTLAIARKEWREVVRDRRSLYSGLFYGVWGPLVMGAALLAMANQHGPLGPITVPAAGAGQAPALAAFLASRQVSLAEAEADPAAAIRDRRLPLALVVDEDYAARWQASRPAEVALLYDSTWPEADRRADHVRRVLAEYAQQAGETRLVVRGVAPPAVTPLRVLERDYATVASRAGRALATMPIFVLLAAFIGGMSVAADVAAGERERGSLESLLLHPVRREVVVLGKWLAVSGAALATVVVALAMSYAVLQHPRLQGLDLPIGLSRGEAAAMLLALAPLALGAAAVQLLMAFHARTYKEAQTKLSMLIFVPMIPGFMFAFGTLEPAPWMAFVPMIGQHMIVTSLVRGEAVAAGPALLLAAATLAVAGAACWTAAGQLGRESVLRRAGA